MNFDDILVELEAFVRVSCGATNARWMFRTC